jgi:hypothetical protein
MNPDGSGRTEKSNPEASSGRRFTPYGGGTPEGGFYRNILLCFFLDMWGLRGRMSGRGQRRGVNRSPGAPGRTEKCRMSKGCGRRQKDTIEIWPRIDTNFHGFFCHRGHRDMSHEAVGNSGCEEEGDACYLEARPERGYIWKPYNRSCDITLFKGEKQ